VREKIIKNKREYALEEIALRTIL